MFELLIIILLIENKSLQVATGTQQLTFLINHVMRE